MSTRRNIIKGGSNVILAHLTHLKDHGEDKYYHQATAFLEKKGIAIPAAKEESSMKKEKCGCPGAAMIDFSQTKEGTEEIKEEGGRRKSQLRQWPVQLHLVPPLAPYFRNKDVILSADCVAYALGDFHKDYLKGFKRRMGMNVKWTFG